MFISTSTSSRLHTFDRQRVIRLLQELEFRSLLAKVEQVEAMLAAREGGAVAPSTSGTVTTASAGQAAITPTRHGPQQMDMFGQPDAVVDNQATERDTVVSPEPLSDTALEQAGVPPHVYLVRTRDELLRLAAKLKATGRFTVDVESTSSDDMEADLVGISIAPANQDGEPQDAYYIPVGHTTLPAEVR